MSKSKAGPMRDDVTQASCICDHACPMTDDRHWVNCPAHSYYAAFLAHTARPDAGEGTRTIPIQPEGMRLFAVDLHKETWAYINHANTWQGMPSPLNARPDAGEDKDAVVAMLLQYIDDLRYPPSADSAERRINAAKRLIAQILNGSKERSR